MSPLAKKKNKKKKLTKKKQSPKPMATPIPTLQSTSDPSLPNNLVLSCLARVSRLHYPALSLVSKSFGSLLASPELYKDRSLLDTRRVVPMHAYGTILIRNLGGSTSAENLTNDTSNKKKSSGYVLAKALIPRSPPVNVSGQGLVLIGSSIYNIGGSKSSSSVYVMNNTTQTWSEAPSFRVKLVSVATCVVDRKIYVADCYKDGDTDSLKHSIEVFDIETQIWDPLPVPSSHNLFGPRKCSFYTKISCIDGKFKLQTKTELFAYNSEEGKWDFVRIWNPTPASYCGYSNTCYCEIENVLYYVTSEEYFGWYDTEASEWRNLTGLEGLPKCLRHVRLADYGGKMMVFWDEEYPYDCPSDAIRR